MIVSKKFVIALEKKRKELRFTNIGAGNMHPYTPSKVDVCMYLSYLPTLFRLNTQAPQSKGRSATVTNYAPNEQVLISTVQVFFLVPLY
jgi:hypothetical protein